MHSVSKIYYNNKLTAFIFLALLTTVNGFNILKDLREDTSLYNIGVGIHDATGPAAGVSMMGYAQPTQWNKGVHIRLFARSFIIDDGQKRLVFVSVDCGMMSQIVRMAVIKRLQEKYGELYSYENVILSGTHTHSGPGGFLQYLLLDITSLGFVNETFEAMVEGTFQSIVRAHSSLRKGYIYVSSGNIYNASINRSPVAYKNNPQEEKFLYAHDTDKLMTLLRFVDVNGKNLGVLNWFAVHPTSMNNTNVLISGDNKGYASQMFEKRMNSNFLLDEDFFVAAFAQSNCGDVSPNIKGPLCRDTGLPCDELTSTCNGRSQLCIADGPGEDMFESTKIIGERQFEKAWELFNDKNAEKLSGPVQYVQQFVDMGNYTIDFPDGSSVKTCEPALGYSFAAGTIDGPGAFNFEQGMTEENPFWNMIVEYILPPRPEQEKCHEPKPVLLDTGNINKPYPWHPRIMDTQIGGIGKFFIVAVPGEFTTMAGRRLRNKIVEIAKENQILDPLSVIAGLSNVYSHYIATFEEYQVQRYEGASTIFGPHTLDAYIQQYSFLMDKMLKNQVVAEGPSPPNLYDDQLSLLPGILYDEPPCHHEFGDVVNHPSDLIETGKTQIATFIAGHPRNNATLGGTFLKIEKFINESFWETIATDNDWETRFIWERTSLLRGTSEATVEWNIPVDLQEGIYRIRHTGYQKNFLSGKVKKYEGITKEFKVVRQISDLTM